MTDRDWTRRDLLALMGVGGVVFASGLAGCARAATSPLARPARDFFFLQLSDTHWGFRGPANPEADTCLRTAVSTIRASREKPAFVVFTGDLTHTTDDAKERRARMAEFRAIVSELEGTRLVFLPGEHDAAPDRGEAYDAAFGAPNQAFSHEGVSFVTLDNASAPGGALGDAQLDWLATEVARVPPDMPLVVFAHRPLFDLYPEWEWATKDGARALEILARHGNVTVFYGHIHQEHHTVTGRITHHSARSLIFPLPAPGAAPKRAPLPWDPKSVDHGLGHRAVFVEHARARIEERLLRTCGSSPPSYVTDARPVLERACFACHAPGGAEADEHDFSRASVAFAQRDRILRQISSGSMPPRPRSPLGPEDANTLLRWAACAAPEK
jgi:hypothetical protein